MRLRPGDRRPGRGEAADRGKVPALPWGREQQGAGVLGRRCDAFEHSTVLERVLEDFPSDDAEPDAHQHRDGRRDRVHP